MAHVGQEFALGLVGVLRFLFRRGQLPHLTAGEAQIDEEHDQHRDKQHGASGHGREISPHSQAGYRVIQYAVGHDRGHGPVGVGHGGTVHVASLPIDGHHHAELLAPGNGLAELFHIFLRLGLLPFFRVLQDPVKAVVRSDLRILDHKGAVRPDDVGENQRVVGV